MKLAEFGAILKQTGLPVAYGVFVTETEPPRLHYQITGDNSFYAENRAYHRVRTGFVEYYFTEKDVNETIERQLEALFEANGVPYGFEYEAFIESEGMFVARWKIQILGG